MNRILFALLLLTVAPLWAEPLVASAPPSMPVSRPAPDTWGVQRTLFVSCVDPDGQRGPALDRLPQEVDRILRLNSNGRAWLQSTALSGVALPRSTRSYLQESDSLNNLQAAVLLAVEGQVDPRNFDRLVLLLPLDQSLPSQGTVGKKPLHSRRGDFQASTCWVFVPHGAAQELVQRAVLHELGHGFGFHHSNAGSECYGDTDDLMGSGYEHYSFLWRTQAKWLDSTEVTVPGDYVLSAQGVLHVRLGFEGDLPADGYWLENHNGQVQVRLKYAVATPSGDCLRLQKDDTFEGLSDSRRGYRLTVLRREQTGTVVRLERIQAIAKGGQ